MITEHKRFSNILKKYLIKLRLRGWLAGHQFYSKSNFQVYGTDAQIMPIAQLLMQCGYEVRGFRTGISAYLINHQQPKYYPQAKLALARMLKKGVDKNKKPANLLT